jgi:hypothetical protein
MGCVQLLVLYFGLVHAKCPGQNLLENPADPSMFGPWPVSSRVVGGDPRHNDGTFIPSRTITGEVFFPAKPGSSQGAQPYHYSANDQNLVDKEAKKVPKCPPSNPHPTKPTCCEPTQNFDHVWSNLTLDTEHGAYPVIIFIHGTAAWRSYMLKLVEHWASRGFVVFAADYPGITQYDLVFHGTTRKTDQEGDTKLIIEELTKLTHPALTFLKGHIDMTRLGITGHSAGGFATGLLSRSIGQVMIPMAGGGTLKRSDSYSTLVLGGQWDAIVGGCKGFATSPRPKRQLCVAKAGHETYTDLCWMAPKQGGTDGIGIACGVKGSGALELLADQGCKFAKTGGNKMNEPEVAWDVVRYATAATFEETLVCDKRMTEALAALPQKYNSTSQAGWHEDLGANNVVV